MRYETWAIEQLVEKRKCSVEPLMTCIPLRGDPICMACYEGNVMKENDAVKKS